MLEYKKRKKKENKERQKHISVKTLSCNCVGVEACADCLFIAIDAIQPLTQTPPTCTRSGRGFDGSVPRRFAIYSGKKKKNVTLDAPLNCFTDIITFIPPPSLPAGISGLIGAGKTTLATALAKELKLPVYYEPVRAKLMTAPLSFTTPITD